MQTLDGLKAKGQASLTNLMDSIKEQPDDIKVWGVAAGSAVVGAVAVNAAARGVIAILGTLTSTPVALTVGAVGGGYLGWTYLQKLQAAEADSTDTISEPTVETIAVIDRSEAEQQPLAAVEEAPVAMETDDSTTPDVSTAEPVVAASADVPPPASPDDLEVIHGIGPVYASRLQSAGIQTFAQLAELSPAQVRELIEPLRSGHMIEPEKWIAEARQLASDAG